MTSEIKANIAGVVFQIPVGVGDWVNQGDPIVILESMKMEIPVEAPRSGVVRELSVREGATVQEGDVVARLE
ncbi:MAG: biotin/lipoyl-binding carrier protein [Candidatus Rokubacteria bacterium]|nr:biotin/lipoyl-binding carrier protein [Candidatus Rokubacteria bacterium]